MQHDSIHLLVTEHLVGMGLFANESPTSNRQTKILNLLLTFHKLVSVVHTEVYYKNQI